MGFLNQDTDNRRTVLTSAYQDTDGKPTTRTKLSGNDMELYGLSTDTKPDPTTVKKRDNLLRNRYI
ncbi:hypothetical protein [Priestia endophytica]|uniref:hypothetical protein n=1 Tax=Priestia endophytica TaxID=135735 RepID=UPI002280423A|nr:hypothetical protein [Priestia endophytica]MCY8234829.1 hypothetical protein [Priestia endophytica]